MTGQGSLPLTLPVPNAGDVVRAISLHEPWASLMRTGAKTIETRDWGTRFRGLLLICAARRRNAGELRDLLCRPAFQRGLSPLFDDTLLDLRPSLLVDIHKPPCVGIEDLLFGQAVALVTMFDCRPTPAVFMLDASREVERDFGNYAPGRWAWMTRDLVRFRPFSVVGRQGFFDVELPADFQAVEA